MDWKTLFLSAEGRIGQKDFWIGAALLFVISLVMQKVPYISWLWALASLYFGVCVYGKRLHDIGKSAWLVLIPFCIMTVAIVLAGFLGSAAFISATGSGNNALAAAGSLVGLGLAGLIILIGAAGSLGFVIWLGTRVGEATENRFGPVPAVPLVTMI